MLPHMLQHIFRARRAATAIWFGAVTLALGACADHTTQAVADALQVRPQFSVSVPDGMRLQCPPSPHVRPRAVTAGTDADRNGNGVVCDEQLGPPGLPEGVAPSPVLTTDDLPLPTKSTTVGVSP